MVLGRRSVRRVELERLVDEPDALVLELPTVADLSGVSSASVGVVGWGRGRGALAFGRNDVSGLELVVDLLDSHSDGVLVELELGDVGAEDSGRESRGLDGLLVSPSRASLPGGV